MNRINRILAATMTASLMSLALPAMAEEAGGPLAGMVPAATGPVPVDFILFALTLLGVAIFHHRVFTVAVTGLTTILAWKFLVVGFKHGAGLSGLSAHISHEWVVIANLFLLLLGFAVLSRHFETSNVPEKIPAILPDNWLGGVVLLALVFFLSSFLDNIAAAMAEHGILAGTAQDFVVAPVPNEDIVANSAVDGVISSAAIERIVAESACNDVLSTATVDLYGGCGAIR